MGGEGRGGGEQRWEAGTLTQKSQIPQLSFSNKVTYFRKYVIIVVITK